MKSSMKDNNNMNNWLGFSLSSPHMKMDQSNNTTSSTNSVLQSNLFHNTSSSICYGLVHDKINVDFHYPSSSSSSSSSSIMPLKSDGSLCLMEAALSTSHSQGIVPISSSPNMFLSNQESHNHQYYSSGLNYNDFFQTTRNEHTELQSSDELIMPCLKTWIDFEQLKVNNGDLQSLSLSTTTTTMNSVNASSVVAMETTKKRRFDEITPTKQTVLHRKSIDTFGQRTSQYRGVTRHRWTGRYEAHLWDNSCKKEGQSRKGRQVYLGGYDMEEKAARAYDLAALKYWGPSTHINFPLENYSKELEDMKNLTRQEHVAHLRRRSSGFSRGASMYRGVTRHHQHGRWQARIGRVAGNKDLYLGTFSTQEEAGEAYDIAAIKFRGVNAVTNFDLSRYDVEKIMASHTLLTGDVACRRNKEEPNTKVMNNFGNVTIESSLGGVKTMNHANYQIGLQGLIGIDSTQTIEVEESSQMAQLPVFATWKDA